MIVKDDENSAVNGGDSERGKVSGSPPIAPPF